MAKKPQKFSDLVPFMLVLGVFCAISIYLMTSFFVTIRGEMMEASTLIASKPVTGEPHSLQGMIFADVPYTHQNGTAILYFRDTYIISGYDDDTFKPDNEVNRAEFLKILVGALGVDVSGDSYQNCFSDVNFEWFAPYICYAKSEGWVGGYADGSYQPAKSVNKAEAVKITAVAFGYDIPASVLDAPYTDTPVDHWYTPYIYVASGNGLLEEGSTAQYYPSDPMKRAGTVELIYRSMNDNDMVKPTI